MLARDLNAEYLSLGKYIASRRLFSRLDERRTTKVVDITKTRNQVRRFTTFSNRPLVVDTHHPEGIIPNNMATFVIVLRCNPVILLRRLRRKKWNSEKIRENVMAETLDSCYIHARSYYSRRKLVQIDTSHSSVKHSVITAKSILSGSKAPILRVDWLHNLENDASLSKFLR